MKAAIFTFLFSLSISIGFAQSITLSPGSVQVPQFAINPTCNVAKMGTLIFNTTQSKAYYCNGIDWQEMGNAGFVLPYTGTTSGSGTTFEVGAVNAIPIKGTSFGNHGIEGVTNAAGNQFAGVVGFISPGIKSAAVTGTTTHANGIGIQATNTAGGLALSVNGGIAVTGANTENGKVLVATDADGNAAWQPIPIPVARKVGFFAGNIMTGGLNVLTEGTWSKVHFLTETYDPGNDYNPTTTAPSSTFTVPLSGYYQFNAQVTWAASSAEINSSGIRFMLKRGTNNPLSILEYSYPTDETTSRTNNISTAYKVLAGDQIWVEARAYTSNNSNPVIRTSSSTQFNQFSGFLIFTD